MPDAPFRPPKHVRDRDRLGRRCHVDHPTRSVRAEGTTKPVHCLLVAGHGPNPERDDVEGHWSFEGGVETEW